MFLPSYFVAATTPVSLLDQRIRWLERYLETPLTDSDETALRVACARSGARFGEFYHLYFQKKVISKIWRTIQKDEILRMIHDLDRSHYLALDAALEQKRGLLLALPHHGLYINTIVAVTERVRRSRDIYIFYGDPATHAGNEVFDSLCKRIWLNDPDSRVHVVYDNRAGLVKAIRALKDGAAVIIMPDVFKNEIDTFQIPFCGRTMNIMLGTAVLARKTDSAILPIVCRPVGYGMNFVTEQGPCISVAQPMGGEGDVDEALLNYRTMLKVFSYCESIMDKQIIHWQFARQLYVHDAEFPVLDGSSIEATSTLLVEDAKVRVPDAFSSVAAPAPLAASA
jgi:lauroyl/myristoyl acyltransferase